MGSVSLISFREIFAKVNVSKFHSKEGMFYRIECVDKTEKMFYAFDIDASDYLLRKVHAKLSGHNGLVLNYEAQIVKYDWRAGSRIPVQTAITQNGRTQESRLLTYHLDVPCLPTDFQPPDL